MAAAAEGGSLGLHSSALCAELVRRAATIAHGESSGGDELALSRELTRRIEEAERRACSLASAGGDCEESRTIAAVDFVASVATTLMLHEELERGELRELVSEAAAVIGMSRGAMSLAVFRRALFAHEVAELPPPAAFPLFVDLLLELAPTEAVSLWTRPTTDHLECIADAGDAAGSRRLRLAARVVLGAEETAAPDLSTHVRAVPVRRWGVVHAALVARGSRPEVSARLGVYLTEAASALSAFFERETLFERNSAHERSLVSGYERRLIRLGCDLHDGPLQEIVALADDLRLARSQVASMLDGDLRVLMHGRFDDLEARLASLDHSLRDISQSSRGTHGAERSLRQALRAEVDAHNRLESMQARLVVGGDLSALTASQSIVLFRVVQEALSNARKHSGATRVRISVRGGLRYLSASISDNGRGFDVDAARRSGRLGLTGVVERVRLLGGDIEIRGGLGRGTRVRAILPRWSRAVQPTESVYAVTA